MKSMKLKNEIEIALFAVLLAVFSWTTIPFAVPFTLQTFGVYVALMLLGGKKGTIAIALYILLGAVGVPVFSGFKGGVGALLGPTGGYIFGFLATGLVYILMEKRTFRFRAPVSLAIGTILCYAFGTIWFVIVYKRKGRPDQRLDGAPQVRNSVHPAGRREAGAGRSGFKAREKIHKMKEERDALKAGASLDCIKRSGAWRACRRSER